MGDSPLPPARPGGLRASVAKFESPDPTQWNACKCAKFRAPVSWCARWRALDQAMHLRSGCNAAPATGSLVHPNERPPNCGKLRVPWSILTEFMQAWEIQGPRICLDTLRTGVGDSRSPRPSDRNACTYASFEPPPPRHSLGMLGCSVAGPMAHLTGRLATCAPRPGVRPDAL